MDLQSILGYASNSPFMGNPYLDIQTPEGLITMENTPIDLLGIDNLGTVKKMKAGRKNPYKFKGDMVREIPMQQGGMTSKQMFDFLFDDEETVKPTQNPTAPTVEEVDMETGRTEFENQQNEMIAMQIAMEGNPYMSHHTQAASGNPYSGDILSSGQFGSKNVGDYGRQIYGELSGDLGYTPTVNSIFRSKDQQDALIASGAPAAKNSWHLTGNAIDLKPADWFRLSADQQLYYKQNYDVIHHNGHVHIEPK